MRLLLITFLACTVTALQLPNLQPFLSAFVPLLDDFTAIASSNVTEHELVKRQSNGCPANWNNCGNLGASGLCCAPNARCTADAANHLACCPNSVTCTGTIGGYITAGTVDANGNQVGGGGAVATTTSSTSTTGYVVATTTTTSQGQGTVSTGNGFVIASGATVAQPGTGSAVRGIQAPLPIRLLQRAIGLFL